MATKLFPKFSQGLAQDPSTRRIWYGLATAHDFESHDGMTEENLYQKIFASHFGQLAIIFLWTSGNLFHVAWQGNFEQWVTDPIHVRPIAHAIWDPHFGQPAVEAFTRGGASGPVNIATSGVYQWWYTIAWTGHLVHVAIPESRGQHVGWDNFLSVLPHPQGLTPFWSGNWAAYAQNPDTASHAFGTADGSGHMYRTNFGIGHRLEAILEAHTPPAN
eukprot:1158766-Pelagomonas_calceolata.AAC.2